MDSKRQTPRPSSGWARRKKLPEVEEKPFYVSIIIDYYDYNCISYNFSLKKDKEEENKHIKGGRGAEH